MIKEGLYTVALCMNIRHHGFVQTIFLSPCCFTAAPESTGGGPSSYICRLSGHKTSKTWRFWLEVSSKYSLLMGTTLLIPVKLSGAYFTLLHCDLQTLKDEETGRDPK